MKPTKIIPKTDTEETKAIKKGESAIHAIKRRNESQTSKEEKQPKPEEIRDIELAIKSMIKQEEAIRTLAALKRSAAKNQENAIIRNVEADCARADGEADRIREKIKRFQDAIGHEAEDSDYQNLV